MTLHSAARPPRRVGRGTSGAVLLAALLLAPSAAARIVLIGVDGASWNLIDPLVAAGELPNLAALMGRGVHANMSTVEPVMSPVVWTSLATGRSPAAHGITDFFVTRLRMRAPSSFERLAASGLRVGLYDYLVTWPPASLPGGFVIPGWLRRDPSLSPSDVWDRIALTPFANSYDDAFTSEHYLERARLDVREKAPRWIALSDAFDLDIGAVSFYAIDITSHRYWEAAFPEAFDSPASGYRPDERSAIREALLGVDRSIGQIAAARRAEDTLLIASDHGFQADPSGGRDVWVTDLHAALANADLDPERDGFSVVGTFGVVAVRIIPGPIEARDETTKRVRALLASFQTTSGDRLYSVVEALDLAERPPEHRRPWTSRLRQWVVKKSAEWMFDVQIDVNAHAVVFALPNRDRLATLWPDGEIQVGEHVQRLDAVLHRQRFTGMHHETAIFVAAGPALRRDPTRGSLSVLDVAPLLFYLAEQPIPDDLEGRLPVEWIRSEYLASHPPQSIPADQLPALTPAAAPQQAVDDEALEEQLRALGYLE